MVRPRAPNFTADEDFAITGAWIHASDESVPTAAADRTGQEFWVRVFNHYKDYYVLSSPDGTEVNELRNVYSVQSRFTRIIWADCNDWREIITRTPCGPEVTTETYKATLHKIFEDQHKKPFRFEICYMVLNNFFIEKAARKERAMAENMNYKSIAHLNKKCRVRGQGPLGIRATLKTNIQRKLGIGFFWQLQRERKEYVRASYQIINTTNAVKRSSLRGSLQLMIKKYGELGNQEKVLELMQILEDQVNEELTEHQGPYHQPPWYDKCYYPMGVLYPDSPLYVPFFPPNNRPKSNRY